MSASILQFTTPDKPRPAHLIRVAVPRLNKCDWIEEYLKQLASRDYDLEWAEVTETKVLTCAEWNELMHGLLEDREWLAGKGGTGSWNSNPDDTREFFQLSETEREQWKRGAYLLVVAVQCAGETIYIDPQGYNYARYVAFAADGLPEGMTRAEREKLRVRGEQSKKLAVIAEYIANPPVVPADHGIRFLWNGLKVDGKLYRCYYSLGNTYHYPADVVGVSARDYESFPAKVREYFHVENNSDSQSDYFDNDHLRICSNHPLYALARAAYEAQQAHQERTSAKRYQRSGAANGSIDQ